MRRRIRILCIFDEDAEGYGPHDLMKPKGRGESAKLPKCGVFDVRAAI